MDHTKARAVAELGNDPFVGRLKREEQAEVCAAYLDALRQLQERDGVVKEMRAFVQYDDAATPLSDYDYAVLGWADRLEAP